MQPYTPPPGTYDLPFTWAFDASTLTDNTTYLNSLVYLKGGYGDFILRRVVGMSRILDPTVGQYQIRDGQSNNIEQFPVFGSSADDIAILPELWYPETGGIRFDLYALLRPTPTSSAQLAFQGVRRMKGSPPANPCYRAVDKTFTHQTIQVNIAPPVGSIVSAWVPIDNYDFELHQIIIAGAVGAAALGPLTAPLTAMWIYDKNKVQISNMPILDLFYDGGPKGIYKNGALVTPLWYPKDSQIQIDFYSQISASTAKVVVYLVGKKYYPC